MDNKIKSRLHQYFRNKFGAQDYHHGWMKMKCPYCGRDQKFGVNISSNRTNCFRCGSHDKPLFMLMEFENIETYSEAIKFLENGNFEGYEFHEELEEVKESKNIILPEGFYNINIGDSHIGKSARNYLKNRGFDIRELGRMGIGYCMEGEYMGYIIIPFYYKGEIIYFNARRFMGDGPRYNNPNTEETGLGKSFMIYNRDALDLCRTIYICEGCFNALTMGEQGIASGGKYLSRYQINTIIKSQVDNVIILLDPDAKDKAIDLAIKLQPYKNIKIIYLPEGKDVNDIGRRETLKLIYQNRYLKINQIMEMKYNYERSKYTH